MSSDAGGSHDHVYQSWDDFVAPLVELVVAICEQDPDALLHAHWLTEQRPFFVVAYRVAAQLRAQAEGGSFLNWRNRTWADTEFPGIRRGADTEFLWYQPMLRPDLTCYIPAEFQWENEGMRREGEAEAELQPHLRWSPDFRTLYKERSSTLLMDELRRVDLRVNEHVMRSLQVGGGVPGLSDHVATEEFRASYVPSLETSECSVGNAIHGVLKQVHPDLGDMSDMCVKAVGDLLVDCMVQWTCSSIETLHEDEDEDDFEIDVDMLEEAIANIGVMDELLKHSKAEGTKACANKGAKLVFPIDGCASVLEEGAWCMGWEGCSLSKEAKWYWAAVLEYLSAEVIELAGNALTFRRESSDDGDEFNLIQVEDLEKAVSEDEELAALFSEALEEHGFAGGMAELHETSAFGLRPLRFEVGQRVLAVCSSGGGGGDVHDDWSYNQDGSRNLGGSVTRTPCTVVWRCYNDISMVHGWLGLAVKADEYDEEMPKDIFYWPYQLLRDDAIGVTGGHLIFAPVDHDMCVRAMTAEEEEMYPPPSFNEDVYSRELIPMLMQRWWTPTLHFGRKCHPLFGFYWTPSAPSVMSPCYNEVDIGGLLDVDVKPGTVGRGLVDVECCAGLRVCAAGLLPDRVNAKLNERLMHIEAAEDARNAEFDAACGVVGKIVTSWWWATEGTPCDDDGNPFYACVITAINADGTYGIKYGMADPSGTGSFTTPPTTNLSYTNAPRTSIAPLQDDSPLQVPLQKTASAEAEATEDGASEADTFWDGMSEAEKLAMVRNASKKGEDALARYRRDGRLISHHDGKRVCLQLFSSWLANHVARLIAQCFFSLPHLCLSLSLPPLSPSLPHSLFPVTTHSHGTRCHFNARIQTELRRLFGCDALALPVLRLWALCSSEGNTHAALREVQRMCALPQGVLLQRSLPEGELEGPQKERLQESITKAKLGADRAVADGR